MDQNLISALEQRSSRVTEEMIENVIIKKTYFTAAQGEAGAQYRIHDSNQRDRLSVLTFCVLTLKNGFTVTGESSCVNDKDFDAEIGEKIALQNAKAKIWPLLGYELRTKLADRAPDYRMRVRQEQEQLELKMRALDSFIINPRFEEVSVDERNLMIDQYQAMADYNRILKRRIAKFDNQ